jgi:hypothetical protein
MQIPLAIGRTVSGITSVGGQTIVLPAVVDVSDLPLLNFTGARYLLGGTNPSIVAQLETSDDLDTWAQVGSGINLAPDPYTLVVVTAKNDPYGRYLRAKLIITGTDVMVSFSLWIETFRSS